MENEPSRIENFDQFYDRIKKLVDDGDPQEQIDLEVSNWFNRRQEETERVGTLPSQGIEFQVEWIRMCVVTYKPNEVINDLIDQALDQVENHIYQFELRLQSITETPDSYVDRYIRINKGGMSMDETDRKNIRTEQTEIIKSEIDTLKLLKEKILNL